MNHPAGLLNVRRIALLAFSLLMALALTTAVAADHAGAKKNKKAKVTIKKIKTKNQAALLNTKKLAVKVKSTGKTKVKLKVKQGGKTNRFKKKTVKFKKNKKQTKTVKLGLTSTGKKKLSTCGAKTVQVLGKYKRGKKSKTAKKKKKLAKSSKQCDNPPTPPNPPTPEKSTCDPLDPAVCMQPWPSNFYTKEAGTNTGVQLDIPAEAMPKNTEDTPIDPTDINRADGFSPGNLIVTKIPEVSTPAAFDNSGIVPLTDIDKYDDPDQAVVVIDAKTGERAMIYAELDANPTTKPVQELTPGQPPVIINGGSPNDDPSNTGPVNLIIRAAKNYTPGHRYIVALRNLKSESDAPVEPAAPFKSCRDGDEITDPALLYRCNELNKNVFPVLSENGISKENLYLAWDFTVASQESTTGRATEIRDDAFSRLGGGGDTNLADSKIAGNSPNIDVLAYCDLSDTSTTACGGDNNPGESGYDPNATTDSPVPNASWYQRTVVGFIRDVPCYLNQDGCPTGAEFSFNGNGDLEWNDAYTVDVPFQCGIPLSVVDGGSVHPGGTGVYGHGLLGLLSQVYSTGSTREVGNETNSSWCATNWDGFSELDFSTVAASLKDLSNFHKLVDRMQQGFVNFMMLSRALAHPDGFADEPAFQMTHDGITPITPGSAIDTSAGEDTRGYYMGISQGGIMGGALTPLSPDVDYGVLGVPGINYSSLLRRSVDFDEYATGVLDLGGGPIYLPGVGLWDNYPNLIERPLILSIMQLPWDRGEGNGYVQTLNPANSPLPNTNEHRVLLRVATGDHQVANVAAEVEARTIDAQLYTPALNAGRSWTGQSFGIDPLGPPIPDGQNAIVYYDGGPTTFTGTTGEGSGVPPVENVPPRPEWGYGDDPHSYPRRSPDGISHASEFLLGQGVTACASTDYCYSNGWDGTP